MKEHIAEQAGIGVTSVQLLGEEKKPCKDYNMTLFILFQRKEKQKNEKTFALLFVIPVLTFFLVSCQGRSVMPSQVISSPQATPAAALQVTSALFLDPALAMDADSQKINAFLYETLVGYQNGEIVPALAVSWSVSEDGLHYTFNLRSDVTFHDGTAFNADAVLANFDRWFNPHSPLHTGGEFVAWKTYFGGFQGERGADGRPLSILDGVEKVNQNTVLFHLNTPDNKFLFNLTDLSFAIASPAALQRPNFGKQGNVAGTGPYYVKQWNAESLILAPNANYWGAVPSEDLVISLK